MIQHQRWDLERDLDDFVKAMTKVGVAYKLHGHDMQKVGIPDWYIAMGVFNGWMEGKAPGKKPTPHQRIELQRLRKAGIRAAVVSYDGNSRGLRSIDLEGYIDHDACLPIIGATPRLFHDFLIAITDRWVVR